MNRPNNDQYFIGIAIAVSKRATCGRRQVGAVLTDRNHRILSTGYNSVASGLPHCPDDEPCPGAYDKSGNTSRCIARHAEDVAIAKCPNIYEVYTAYVTTQPCAACVRRLLDTGCQRIVFKDSYPCNEGEVLWVSQGRKWAQLK
jgi:dCMP deaminase